MMSHVIRAAQTPSTISLLTTLFLFSVLPTQTSGAVAVGNLTKPVEGSELDWNPMAMAFTTGPLPSVLSSITVHVTTNFSSSVRQDTFALSLRADEAGQPGSVLESFPSQLTTTAAPTRLLTYPSSGLPPQSNATYWLVLSHDQAAQGIWLATYQPGESAYGWSIADFILAQSPAGLWHRVTDLPEVGRFQIDATILPEPTTAACAFSLLLPLLRRPRKSHPRL